MMVDGRADLYVMRLQHVAARAVLDLARPVLEARGSPARKTAFYRLVAMQRLIQARLRVGEEDIAQLRASVVAAEQSSEKDVGYATGFLGWALWLRGDLTEAAEELEKALAMADRIGESVLHSLALRYLMLVAVRRHDAEQVRKLFPVAYPAGGDVAPCIPEATALACSAWLAWRDGNGDEVRRLAARIGVLDPTMLGSGAMYRWVYMFPLIAAELSAGDTGAAVRAARQILNPTQQLLDDDLMAALADAGAAWDRPDPAAARRQLEAALKLAHARDYF
jgi:tetratricopeptide (TPR) repeat protein